MLIQKAIEVTKMQVSIPLRISVNVTGNYSERDR